eukprot:491222_1
MELSTNSLNGSISNTICNLQKLQILYLYKNDLSGSIPECIGNLTALTDIALDRNSLNGTIPNTICKLNGTQLQTLNLFNNYLCGSIPECIGNLTNLVILSIGINSIYGKINSFPPNIQRMYLYDNKLNGDFPVLPSTIQHVIAHDNYFTGTLSTIFQNVVNMTNLEMVTLNNNHFSDDNITDLLHKLFLLPQLITLSISNNGKISGEILDYPTIINQSTLEIFLANDMNLYGSLPHNLTFTKIKYMTLYNNRLSCSLPNNLIAKNT